MSNTRTDWAENLKRLGCLVAIICIAAVVAGLFAPLQPGKARAESFVKKGKAAFEAEKYESAVECYSSAAELGNAEAQYELGNCFALGKGVKASREEAVKWWQKAAEGGHVEAQYTLGQCYDWTLVFVDGDDSGEFVELDEEEAAKWYQKAAEQGHKRAQSDLKFLKDFPRHNVYDPSKDVPDATEEYDAEPLISRMMRAPGFPPGIFPAFLSFFS